jgi:type VI secretion system secreted protein Hcp
MEHGLKHRANSGRLRAFIIGSSALIFAATTSAVAVAASSSPHSLSGAGVTSITLSGIPGEGGTGVPTGGIQVLSYSWGMAQGYTPLGVRSGRANFQDISITKTMDKASALLFQACAAGTVIATVVLRVSPPPPSGAAPGDMMTITLNSVHISSYHFNSSSGGDAPTESISLNFTKIKMDYFPQGSSVAVHGGWDLATNKKV